MNEEKKIINTFPLTLDGMEILDGIANFEFWTENHAMSAIDEKNREIEELIKRAEELVKTNPCPHNEGVLRILKGLKTKADELTDTIYRGIEDYMDLFADFNEIHFKEAFDDDDLRLYNAELFDEEYLRKYTEESQR